MNNYLIYTDSAADLPVSAYEEYDIRIIPMTYLLDGESITFYTNSDTREATCTALYERLRKGADVHTSQITPYTYIDIWEKELQSGSDILYLAFSSGMSATYENALQAAEMLLEKYPDRRIEVVDSLAGTAGQGLLTYTAAMRRAGGSSLDDNAAWLKENAVHMCHFFTVGDLDFLHRGGRVSAAVALIGGMLNVKPLLIIADDGKLEVISKSRGQNAALKALVQNMVKRFGSPDYPDIIYMVHSGMGEKADQLRDMVRAAVGEKTRIECLTETPILGVHTGPEFFALCFFGSQRK